ncbi:MAG: hypothetical protein IT303_17830 [Dehalococcoidia bacterium]|nr:hypothetical protein [Dehalococcoidia bacterium]
MHLRPVFLLAPMLAITLMLSSCGGDDNDDKPTELTVTVEAEILEPGATAHAEPGAFTTTADGHLAHELRVSWAGEAAVVFEDARFVHHVEQGDGHLVLAGRGCGAQWDDERDLVLQACTADLQLIRVEPGRDHAYPLMVFPEVGPLRLRAGTYVVEEAIDWWDSPVDSPFALPDTPTGTFTIRLTYTVR